MSVTFGPVGPDVRVRSVAATGSCGIRPLGLRCLTGVGWLADTHVMRRNAFLRLSVLLAGLGMLLAVLGSALITSRVAADRAQLDRSLTTAAGEKAALTDTELQRIEALALVTSRIPPFSEFYADEGSQAAKIAAVAGPSREINEALKFLWQLYPDRLVEIGYVDVRGAENARIVNGTELPAAGLLRDVRSWPSFRQGVSGRAGSARVSAPFYSAAAHTQVVAATVPVAVDGRIRAYVELQLSTAALDRVLRSDGDSHLTMSIVTRSGAPVAGTAPRGLAGLRSQGLSSAGDYRYAVRAVPQAPGWVVVTGAKRQSAVAVAAQPTQAGVLALAALLFGLATIGFRRARAAAAEEFAAEQRARADAEQRSRIDALTGLFNRRHTMETIEHELARGSAGPGVGILMVDVDYFKRINDRLGHAGGDTVLMEIAERLRLGVREWDVVARIGGEEFCVIAPGLGTEDEVARLGERLRAAVAERPIQLPGGLAVPVTVSVGAALVPHHDGTAEHALDAADRALYAAKRHGVCGSNSAAGCMTSAKSRCPTQFSPSPDRSPTANGRSCGPTRPSAPTCSSTFPNSPRPARPSGTTMSATTARATPAASPVRTSPSTPVSSRPPTPTPP